MHVEIASVGPEALADYARIPIEFTVEQVLDVGERTNPRGPAALAERPVPIPYIKDYDALPHEGPRHWAKRFNLSTWGLFLAGVGGDSIGGAAIAVDDPAVELLQGRRELAVLWDLRVAPTVRRHGIGRALFQAAETWARDQGCRQLLIETQHINAPACRFYARQGCQLDAICRDAYPALPAEVQLLWSKDLAAVANRQTPDDRYDHKRSPR